jgi:hypothetical protein
VELL